MKAFLLAAGRGTRLRPITDKIPKCLVPINGKPLLDYWLKLCEQHGVDEALINLHHLPQLVEEYLAQSDFNIKIETSYEERLLGSAGTIAANADFIRSEEAFFIFYADNLTNLNLQRFLGFHWNKKCIFTMGLFQTNVPQQCGIAELNEYGLVVDFVEKPQHPKSNLANAGVYVASPEILCDIPDKPVVDLGYDVLPRLVNRMYGYRISEYLLDIGNIANYKRAQKEWPKIARG